MSKQASKVCFSLFIVLALLANCCVSEDSSEQYAPTASESESTSSDSYVSVPPSTNIPNVETESDQTLEGEQNFFDQQLAPSPSVNIDPTIDNNILLTSPSPSFVDDSVLDTRDMDNISQENTSVDPLPNADPPASETEKSSIDQDLFQENTSLPPTLVPSSSPPSLTPAYFDTSDGGSFTQENHSPAPPSNTVSETSENVPQFNDYSSLPNVVVPAPSAEALSYPELDPTKQSTPSNDYTLDSAPTSDDHQHTILPSSYRAEDEPVEPYEDEEEEDSWNGANGAVAGVFVGACVIGVGGFMYQKKKKDTTKAQYESLAKKDDV